MKIDRALQVLLLWGVLSLHAAAATASEYRRTERYHDQVVVQCDLTDNFFERLASLQERDFVDPWGLDEERRLHVRLGAQRWSELQSSLPECSVAIANVEDYMVQAEMQMFSKSSNLRAEAEMLDSSKGYIEAEEWFKEYHQYEEIVGWYEDLSKQYSSIVKFVESIGESFEGRKIPAVHFTGPEASPKYTIYFQCQIHAREWISSAVCMYIANYFCEKYGKDNKVTKLLDELEFVFVPIVNPDGYTYTWGGDRMWRKNRRMNSGSECLGVDLNRNYNDYWNKGGSYSNPCSEIYCGEKAASEPETQATQNYFMAQKKVVAAIDWHSYSQLILRPYGWTTGHCPDETRLKAMGDKMSAKIKAVHGSTYKSETAAELYIASGGASDWFYGDEATKENDGHRAAGYTIELRDTGDNGFILPPDQVRGKAAMYHIIPTAEEVIPAVLYLAETMLDDPIVSE